MYYAPASPRRCARTTTLSTLARSPFKCEHKQNEVKWTTPLQGGLTRCSLPLSSINTLHYATVAPHCISHHHHHHSKQHPYTALPLPYPHCTMASKSHAALCFDSVVNKLHNNSDATDSKQPREVPKGDQVSGGWRGSGSPVCERQH
jgi:hypothetical protein